MFRIFIISFQEVKALPQLWYNQFSRVHLCIYIYNTPTQTFFNKGGFSGLHKYQMCLIPYYKFTKISLVFKMAAYTYIWYFYKPLRNLLLDFFGGLNHKCTRPVLHVLILMSRDTVSIKKNRAWISQVHPFLCLCLLLPRRKRGWGQGQRWRPVSKARGIEVEYWYGCTPVQDWNRDHAAKVQYIRITSGSKNSDKTVIQPVLN